MTIGTMWGIESGARMIDEGFAAQARIDAAAAQDDIRELQERIDKLTVITYALWTMLQDKLGFTEAQLLERVKVVDLLDGNLDGRVREKRDVAKCNACGRTMSRRHLRCMYCGAENLTIGAFEALM